MSSISRRGDVQNLADRLNPAGVAVLVDEVPQDLSRRSRVGASPKTRAIQYAALVAADVTPLIIDCGANSGMATKFFGQTFPAARVVAVEPDGANMALAKANNADTETRFYLAGVGATIAVGRITDAKADNWSFSLVHDPLGDVRIVSVNSILEECCTDGVVPFIIKIDIEGFESDLFERDIQWIERFPVLVIELHDWMFPKSGRSRSFLKAISGCDRDFVYCGENVFSISNTHRPHAPRETTATAGAAIAN